MTVTRLCFRKASQPSSPAHPGVRRLMKHIQPTRLIISKIADDHDIDGAAIDSLIKAIGPIVEEHGFRMSQCETISLGLAKFAISECSKCGVLAMNRDTNPSGFDQGYVFENLDLVIVDGGSFNGDHLCGECLPTTHRWGHHE